MSTSRPTPPIPTMTPRRRMTDRRTFTSLGGAVCSLLARMSLAGDCCGCFVSHCQTRMILMPRQPSTAAIGEALSNRHARGAAAALASFEAAGGRQSDDGEKIGEDVADTDTDTRPHEQRRDGPRMARRMNHAFQHLYRHDVDVVGDFGSTSCTDDDDVGGNKRRRRTSSPMSDAREYLIDHGGYGCDRVDEMSGRFPPLLTLDVERHLGPKLRFLKYTLGGVDLDFDADSTPSAGIGTSGNSTSSNHREKQPTTSARSFLQRHIRTLERRRRDVHRGETTAVGLSPLGLSAPPEFFGARLERTVAPRHAFLVYLGLPCGVTLLEDDATLLREFLAARSSKQFAGLCNRWRGRDRCGVDDRDDDDGSSRISSSQVEAFESMFRRGIMAAVRDDMDPNLNSGGRHAEKIGIDSGTMVELLVSHGANPHGTDERGVSLLHWACGAGNLGAVVALSASSLGAAESAVRLRATRDGATPLHWAACGVRSKDFGTGGSLALCRWLVENGAPSSARRRRELIDAVTKDGNSVLMWAAWSGSFDVVGYLVNEGADVSVRNRNGCTVAHWAASGGDLAVCEYLRDEANVDFDVVNNGGNSPLSHAVSYGRENIVSWLLGTDGKGGDDGRAVDLAQEFVRWTEGDPERKRVLDLFL